MGSSDHGARRRALLRAWRLAALVLAAVLLRWTGERSTPVRQADGPTLAQVLRWFPDATGVRPGTTESASGTWWVSGRDGTVVGTVVSTSPEADAIVGYSGPNRVWVALDGTGRIAGLDLADSGDTPAHVAEVERAAGFWRAFLGWRPAGEPPPRIQAVAGSTLTSLGIAEAVERRLTGRSTSWRFPEPISLDEARSVWPDARVLREGGPRPGWVTVVDGGDRVIGFAIRSAPFAESVRGHGGPTEVVAFVGPDARAVQAVRMRRSYDEAEFADRVREDTTFWEGLSGRTVEDWARLDFKKARIEGVSGATETSYAAVEGLRRRLASDVAGANDAGAGAHGALIRSESAFATRPGNSRVRDAGLLAIVAGSLAMAFLGGRGRPWARRAWQVVLVGGFGAWLGDLLSLAVLAGWARNGLAWRTAPTLVLLAGLAFLVPWTTRRQWYCHHLCPHGVLQEWLAGRSPWKGAAPRQVARWLEWFPGVLLGGAFLATVGGGSLDLARLEPFDAWTAAGWWTASAVLAIASLVVASRVPMAYCRFGCPTGALLRFARPGGAGDRFGIRDWAALGLLLAGAGLGWARNVGAWAGVDGSGPATVVLGGRAFGTTWSAKLRGVVPDRVALERQLADELERVESTLSHWRTNSATARFNASATTLRLEMPREFVSLVARCLDLSRASDGAFDITVAPLVRAWGFGPGVVPSSPPGIEELERLRARVGWTKLTANVEEGWVRKAHPELQLDLGAILQGYAADRLAERLRASGHREFLLEVGGELLAGGTWTVAVEDPARSGRSLRTVTLTDAALATSGTYRTRRGDGGRVRSHLVDPRTGRPVDHDVVLASVVASSCAEADAWATAWLVSGRDGEAATGFGALTMREGNAGRRRVSANPEFPGR